MKKEVSLSLKCPNCCESLMDEKHLIGGNPAIKINIETEHDRGVLRLCCLYGDGSKWTDVEMNDGDIVDMFCPHCNHELSIKENCKECGAPLVAFFIKAGGTVRICSRNGCTNHHIVFKEVSEETSKLYYEYGF